MPLSSTRRHTRSSQRSIRSPPRRRSNSTEQLGSLASNHHRPRYGPVAVEEPVDIASAAGEDSRRNHRLHAEVVRKTGSAYGQLLIPRLLRSREVI